MPSDVLFASMAYTRYDASLTLPAKFGRLLEKSPVADMVKGKTVAIKMHVGDNVGYSTIPPVFIRTLVDFVQKHGGDCFITDHAVAERHPERRGYTDAILGCPILDDCGHLGKYFYTKEADFLTLKHVDIAGLIHDADVLINFSHVKGHGCCGFGGACKNLAMGCVTGRTRTEIHKLEGHFEWDEALCTHCEQCLASCNHHANGFDKKGAYHVNAHHCTICQHCVKVCPTGAIKMQTQKYADFQEGMALCTKAIMDTFEPGRSYHINVLTQITALCDCWGMTTPSLVPDIGIMASDDLVAVERASLDAIRVEDLIPVGVPSDIQLSGTGHLLERLHGKDPYLQIQKLEENGLGTQEYALIDIE